MAEEAKHPFAIDVAIERLRQAVRGYPPAVMYALHDEGLPDDAQLRFVSVTESCTADATVVPTLALGTQFTVCVSRHAGIPAVPRFLSGQGITTVGRYTVHLDDYRAAP